MTVDRVIERMEAIRTCRPSGWREDEAVNAGLSLILADAARINVQKGDLKTAKLCVKEAVMHLGLLRSGRSC